MVLLLHRASIIRLLYQVEVPLVERRSPDDHLLGRNLSRGGLVCLLIRFSSSVKNFILQLIDGLMDKLSSFTLEGAVENLKHGLLVNVVLIVDFLEKTILSLLLSLSLLFCVGQLIDLFINLLQVKVVLRWIRATASRECILRVIFSFDLDMVVGRVKLVILEVKSPILFLLYLWPRFSICNTS
jgi:hypothetical protein